MTIQRRIRLILKSRPTLEGAGVRLRRVFGFNEVPKFDPFLLLDHFGSDNPKDYIAGFPWHPHRGIETITYMLSGEVKHGDSLGNSGVIRSGDVQWMTAGSGIVHEELPQRTDGIMKGFQLWANLPKSNKMMNPRYRDITSDLIPEVKINNWRIKIVSGSIEGTKGPVQDIVIDPEYLDVIVEPKSEFIHSVNDGHTVFAYVIEGQGYFDSQKTNLIKQENIVLYGNGEEISITSTDKQLRFLFISGKPIGEPIAWRGPIVMNTDEELRVAFEEYHKGTFIKYKNKS
jgi:redox-sensitive bicupin YhaK (pirin superfamily)